LRRTWSRPVNPESAGAWAIAAGYRRTCTTEAGSVL
jgi:hypothetical protein